MHSKHSVSCKPGIDWVGSLGFLSEQGLVLSLECHALELGNGPSRNQLGSKTRRLAEHEDGVVGGLTGHWDRKGLRNWAWRKGEQGMEIGRGEGTGHVDRKGVKELGMEIGRGWGTGHGDRNGFRELGMEIGRGWGTGHGDRNGFRELGMEIGRGLGNLAWR